MFRHSVAIFPLLVILALSAGCERKVSFAKDVRPILNDHCLECHATGKEGYTKSGLNMESYAGLMKGTKFGPVIEPGSSISSTLFRLIDHKADPSINMPHNKTKIEEQHIELIKRWIDQGAKDN